MAKKPNIKSETLYRSFELNREALKDDRTIEMSFASEEAVDRWFGKEILDCDEKSIDLSRLNNGGALLVEHNTSDQVGVVERAWVDSDKKCRAVVRFGTSARANEIYEDVKNKIRRLVSVGYRVKKMVTEKVEEGLETFRVTNWLPLELSIVSVPADASVGIGRTANTEQNEIIIESQRMAEDKTKTPEAEPVKPAVQVVADHTDAIKVERERVKEINAIADRLGTDSIRKLAKQFIEDGRSLHEFQDFVLRNEFKAKPVDVSPNIGMSPAEVKRYSFINAIRSLANDKRLEGLEKEAHDAVAKQLRKTAGALEFFIPNDIEARALTAGSYAGGAATIQTELLPGSLIELVRNQMFVQAMGARTMGGLVGDIAIPRQSGAATAYWLAETATLSATTQTFGQLTLTPHRLGAATAYTNQFLAQTSIDAESFVRQDLATVIALEKDETALNGAGTDGEPVGITKTTSVNICTMASTATLSYAQCVSFETVLATANTLNGSLGWLTTPYRRSQLRTTFVNTTGGETALWNQSGLVGSLIGYPARVTNQVSSTYPMIFGDWSQLILADWAGISVLVDPYSLSLTNQVRVVVQLMCDVGIRQPKAFAYANQ